MFKFNNKRSRGGFGGDAQIKFYLDYIKAFPEECPNILRVIKARLTTKDHDDAHIGDFCAIIEGILLQQNEYCREIFELVQIIYAKYRRTPLSLLIRIINKDGRCAQKSFEMLIQWLKVNCWSEGKLTHLYQYLTKLSELHPEYCNEIFRVASYAVLRLENDSYSMDEAKKLFNNLSALSPELKKTIKSFLTEI